MSNALVPYSEKRAAAAAKYVEQTRAAPMGDLLRVKGGLFMIGEDSVGDQLCVTVINSIYVNTYYSNKYIEGQADSPTCYAYGFGDEPMAPHPSMAEHLDYFQPQHDECQGCPMNEWGSSDKGSGKACQNRVRLAVIQAGQFLPRPKSRDFDLDLVDGTTKEGQEHFRDADALTINLPVTSVKNWNEYVRKLAELGEAPYGVATRMYVKPHPKFQYTVEFEMLEQVANEAFDITQQRCEATLATMATPYKPPRPEDEERNERRGGVKGLVRR
jgi:hypothetical protein